MTYSAHALHVSPSDRRLGHRLDREWSQLKSRPLVLRRAAGWAIVEGAFDDLDQLLTAVGYAAVWTPDNEAAMRRLVLRAADDELAARVVVQRILPGLLAVVRRRPGRPEDVLDELIGAAWIAIRTFNPRRQARCVAAALIADADYRAFRLAWRRASNGERPTDQIPERPDERDAETPQELVASLFEQAIAAGVPAADLDLMRRLIDETSTEELARALNVTARTVRNRRARITDRLREVALAA
jgi:RNA polymerase sigma factor (sigma-70 family)